MPAEPPEELQQQIQPRPLPPVHPQFTAGVSVAGQKLKLNAQWYQRIHVSVRNHGRNPIYMLHHGSHYSVRYLSSPSQRLLQEAQPWSVDLQHLWLHPVEPCLLMPLPSYLQHVLTYYPSLYNRLGCNYAQKHLLHRQQNVVTGYIVGTS
jgi:hypothetical protein